MHSVRWETRAGQGAKLLEDVLSYIQEHMTDIQAKNQIFPRAVCLYCRYVTGEANAQKRYLLCRKAFENSRKDQRFEYTVELLGYMRKDAICLGKEFEAVSYQVGKDFGSDVSGIWRGNSAGRMGN